MMHTPDPTPIDPALAHTQRRFAQLDADTPTPQLDYVQRRRLLSELQARLLRTQPLPGIAIQQHFVSAPGREIAVRSYTPAARASASRSPPVQRHNRARS